MLLAAHNPLQGDSKRNIHGFAGEFVRRDHHGGDPPGNKEAVLAFGAEFAYQQCTALLEAGVPGMPIYTMDRSPTVTSIVARLREAGYL